MGFMHYDLGALGRGKVVEVVLQGNTANVYLMDNENYMKYMKALPFVALGGLMTFSPIRLQTIENTQWHLIIDLPHGTGKVKTAYRLTDTKLPNISTRPAMFRPTEVQKKAIAAAVAANLGEVKGVSDKAPDVIPAETPPPAKQPPAQVSCDTCGILTIRGKFCTECGAPMERICPTCSSVNPLTSKFCFECGCKI